MTESELPPECLDDDPPEHCYPSEAEPVADVATLPEAGAPEIYTLILLIAVMLLVGGGCMRKVVR